jgi:hypothetical protein
MSGRHYSLLTRSLVRLFSSRVSAMRMSTSRLFCVTIRLAITRYERAKLAMATGVSNFARGGMPDIAVTIDNLLRRHAIEFGRVADLVILTDADPLAIRLASLALVVSHGLAPRVERLFNQRV